MQHMLQMAKDSGVPLPAGENTMHNLQELADSGEAPD